MSLLSRTAISVAGMMMLVVLALWLPFGWILPLHEPWGLHSAYDTGRVPTVTLTGIRSLHFVVPWLAYKVAPNSFLGYHALQIVGFWAKGFIFFLILRRVLPQNPAFAAAAGVLLIIFPADDAIFFMQATLHHIGLSLLLLSFYLYLLLREHRHPPLLFAVVICQWASVSVYEAGLALMFVVPLLHLWLERDWSRRSLWLSAAWLLVPTLWAINILLVFLKPKSEQGYLGQVADPVLRGEGLLHSMIDSAWAIYPKHFVLPWLATLRDIRHWRVAPLLLLVAAAVALLTASTVMWLRRQRHAAMPTGRLCGLLMAGLVMVLLGFVMYLPTELQTTSRRTFLFTAIGASITVISLCHLLGRVFREHQDAVSLGLVAAVTFTAFAHVLTQYDSMAQHSVRLQKFLSNVLTTVPNVEPGTHIYLLGDDDVEPNDVVVLDYYDDNTFAYLYGDYTIEKSAGHFNKGCINLSRPRPTRYENCAPGESGIIVPHATDASVIPYDRVVAVRFDKHGNTTLLQNFPVAFPLAIRDYNPERLIRRDRPYPLHARSVLGM